MQRAMRPKRGARQGAARNPSQGQNTARGNDRVISHPPSIQNIAVTHSTRLRFITNAAVAQTAITFQNLLDSILVATTNLAPFDLFQQVRVRSVELWAVPVLGGATTVQCEFRDQTAGFVGDAKIHSDTSMGVQPAHLRVRPAAKSGTALFQFSSANSAFTLTCPSGTVVDVELTFRGLPQLATAAQNASVGAAAGAWYFRGLDGLAKAATVFVPVIDAASQL